MTALKDKITARIAAGGPMSVADYMAMCLTDPEHGYYTAREPFGRKGDFITAPEVSQMFGELIGAFAIAAYEAMGAPDKVQLAELGPGRGTLMADLLRTAALRPSFASAIELNLVEMSPRLRTIQAQTIGGAAGNIRFLNQFAGVPDGPVIVIANEFFDALPIHQFVRTPQGWRERQAGIGAAGELCFGAGSARLEEAVLPAGARAAPDGAILETQPAANAIAEQIGGRIASQGGAALIIDYGYLKSAYGDTLQALYKHAFDDVLAHPGEADLTAHVNFEALARSLESAGAAVAPPLEQGEFLLRLGLLERAGQLGAGKSAAEQDKIRDAVERLAGPEQMGRLFKVLAAASAGVHLPPFDKA